MDHHQRALDLYKMLFLSKSRELAVQLAQHARASALVERMTNIVSAPDTAAMVEEEQQSQPVEPKPKRILYVPEDDTQLPVFSQDSILSPLSQERVNPFAKRTEVATSAAENYVNVLEKLSK